MPGSPVFGPASRGSANSARTTAPSPHATHRWPGTILDSAPVARGEAADVPYPASDLTARARTPRLRRSGARSGAGAGTRGSRGSGPHRGPLQARPHRGRFPRVQELAPGVYSYEQPPSAAGEELFTTVSMFVVTEEGGAGRRRAGQLRGNRADGRGDREGHRPADHPRGGLLRPRGPHRRERRVSGGRRVHRPRELGGGHGADARADPRDPGAGDGHVRPDGPDARWTGDRGPVPGPRRTPAATWWSTCRRRACSS